MDKLKTTKTIEISSVTGYCFGVKSSINNTITFLKLHQFERNVIIGGLINNQKINNELISLGAELIYEKETNNTNYIVSAHGFKNNIKNIALDSTCPILTNLFKKIEDDSTENIIFIGDINHPEIKSVLEINNNILVIESVKDLENLDPSLKYKVYNQTTFNPLVLDSIHENLKNNFKNSIVINSTCPFVLERINYILNNKADIYVVVGDQRSNNTKTLASVARLSSKISITISKKDEINLDLFKDANKIIITSGTSTDHEDITQVYDYLVKNL
jgi:4-hydroxy-3-methylbut-2-enyl diphosphate reductase